MSENKGLCIHYIDNDLGKIFLQSKANWIRSDIGTSAWDNIYQFAKQNNIKLLGILDYNIVSDNFTLNDWKTAVENAVNKYDCDAYEIWNEPFSKYSQKGYENGSYLNYVNMVITAYKIIKKIRPNSLVIGGGGLFNNQINIALNLIALDVEKYVDAISLHIYWNVPKWLSYILKYYYNIYINSVIKNYKNIFRVPLWVSETGMQFTQCSWLNAVPKNIMTFWYEFQDNDGKYGIIDKYENKKHSFECFKEW